jgi:hypothetical protein
MSLEHAGRHAVALVVKPVYIIIETIDDNGE